MKLPYFWVKVYFPGFASLTVNSSGFFVPFYFDNLVCAVMYDLTLNNRFLQLDC